ncbi:unnamed protein product [Closterium sp. NIES-54]
MFRAVAASSQVFLGFPPDTPGWQFYHPTSRRVLSSQDVTFDESVPYYRLFPYRTAPLPPFPLFLMPVDAVELVEVVVESGTSGGAEPACEEPGGAGSGGAEPERAEPGGAGSGGAEPKRAEPEGAGSGGAEPGVAESGGAEHAGAGPGSPSSALSSPQEGVALLVQYVGLGASAWRAESSGPHCSSCEAEIYTGAMAALELCWLTYLLTDLGELPRSPPVLYVDNKAMLAFSQEHRLEHRTKHIALCYFLARELQQRGQLRLAYVASQANTADIFTKALQPCDHQRFCTMLCLVPTWPHLLTS